MGFQFTFLCDLLSSLDDSRTVKASATATDGSLHVKTVAQWFARHGREINNGDTDRTALLSCMFPEKRTDRVYYMPAAQLSRIIGRCLGLGSSRLSELNRWQRPGGSDLGGCVEDVMRQAENYVPAGQELTVEEIDCAMAKIASRCRFSGPSVRRIRSAVDVEEVLSKLYRRASSRDAKWLTRLVLKTYSPVVFPQNFTLKKFHFLLPHLFRLQNSFEGALGMLSSDPICQFPPNPDPKAARSLSSKALQHLRPRPGIKVGRPDYYKARSIKHCLEMINGRRMSLERKYDGEYYSTADKDKILPVIEECLRMRLPGCKFTHRCILEGELLVFNDQDAEILDFNRLRRLIPRSGTLIGVDSDSPPQPYEHLMMMFFDILLLDDDVCLAKPQRERRLLLRKVVNTIPGRAELAHQEVLDFNQVDSPNRLVQRFEKAITQRWEGFILKASDEPYFPIYCAGVDRMFGRWIKLKKDYIPGLGDTLDFALIGAYYNSQDALHLGRVKGLKFTHFFVGCLLNKEDVVQSDALPHFQVVDVIGRHSMSILTMQTLNQMGEFCAREPDNYDGFRVEYGHQALPIATTLFKHPFIVEMLGSGFDKPSNARYWTLRFPRILKVHDDRSLEEAVSFQELQCHAEAARAVPTDELEELEEREKWSKRLKAGPGLSKYMFRSSSPEATCSDTDDDDGTTPPSSQPDQASQDINASDSMMEVRPLMVDLLDDSMGGDELGGLHKTPSSTPMVYVDEPAISTDVQNPVPENSVLAENDNLSSRQKPSQGNEKSESQDIENLPSHEQPAMPPLPGVTCPMRTTSIISAARLHFQASQSPQEPHLKTAIASASSRLKRKMTPKSPLATIPMWTPKASFGSFNLPPDDSQCAKDNEQHDLRQFLQCICSESMDALLRQSNPYAASQGTRFGIVMFDPKTSRLGEEMLKVATNIASVVLAETHPVPSVGKIFFLGSSILDRDWCPNDLRFCLRDTWIDVGRHDSYGCISWNLNRKSNTVESPEPVSGSDLHSHDMRDQSSQRNSSVSKAPVISITFDESDVAELGEYASLEPLAHIFNL
ncbi:hypothetical protein N7461_001811 [Penicillium sp. DV-2018c]|nr:hypothetical protein N7461_001811 [Penicillium sp. DV-2018c]